MPSVIPKNEKEECELRNIHVPYWIVRVTEYVVVALVLGWASSFMILFVWVMLLNSSATQIKENQDSNRAILEKNQKAIIERIEINTKRLERKIPEAVEHDLPTKQP